MFPFASYVYPLSSKAWVPSQFVVPEIDREQPLFISDKRNPWCRGRQRFGGRRGGNPEDPSFKTAFQSILGGKERNRIIDPDPVQRYRDALVDPVIEEDILPVLDR
jgi:hypothetical protein